MYVAPQEIPFDQLAYPNFGSPANLYGSPGAEGDELSGAQGDNVSRFQAPAEEQQLEQEALDTMGSAAQTAMNPIGALLTGLGSLLSQLAGALGSSQGGSQLAQLGQSAQPQQFFQSATAGSVGDPHCSFSATAGNGETTRARWNSMQSHRNLLDSNSFAGGYRITTQVTQPNAKGITLNQCASVDTGDGATRVSLDAGGDATLYANGVTQSIADGEQVNLGNGETVTRTDQGAVIVRDENGQGGSITATLSTKDGGVNVWADANEVDLGGYLAGQGASPAAFAPTPNFGPPAPATQVQPYGTGRRYTMDEGLAGTAATE